MATDRKQASGDADGQDESLRHLLDFVHASRGFDFSGYKKSSLERRISKRMQEVHVESYAEYQDYLEVNPHEFSALFNTILINVTSFFRDRPAWGYLSETIVPELAQGSDVVRVWSAGCASGEEAYTIAMVLAEAMGEQQFRDRVKIYATDLDEVGLNRARQAVYTREGVKGVPPELLERYFEAHSQGYVFRPDLRRSVIFGRNDLVQDAPISRVDLLVSRNVLMYFTAEAQARILDRFNFALTERGFLFLGKSEMLITHTDLFTPHNLKWRVFRKVPRNHMRDRLAAVGGGGLAFSESAEPERYAELRSGAFALLPLAEVVVGRTGFVVEINQRARELFGLRPADVGRPFQDLDVSYQPVDLRSAITQAYDTGTPVRLDRVTMDLPDGEARTFEVEVRPVPATGGGDLGVAISFQDTTVLRRLSDEHADRKRELETAYEELQSTVEELETTNEELQSTNEELETTNEELQSTNEELETMNEELQSTNDELENVNTRQVERTLELDRVNMFLEGILTSIGLGVIVLDPDQRVNVWNGDATELWGVRPEEVEGRRLSELDIGLPTAELAADLDAVLSGSDRSRGRTVEAINRRGRTFRCAVRMIALANDGGPAGALVLMADRTGDRDVSLAMPEDGNAPQSRRAKSQKK
jgi:two-component system CheB/CheR fusion protein